MELHLTLQVSPSGVTHNEEALAILNDDLVHLLEVTFERFNLGEPIYELQMVGTVEG